ncbi:MAG: hypothetical protein PF795_02845 [Kiritimatiellae bacterium]|jgi:tetratricopeptide (TPR) repeat protein|nr:hypothetical protein [Kiritimatiellia bacterium]
MSSRKGYQKSRKLGVSSKVLTGELVLLDSTKIRRKVLGNCKRARTTFQKAEKELQEFESVVEPAFERWKRSLFGPEIQEVESLKRENGELNQKMQMLTRIVMEFDCTPEEALEMYEKQQKAGREPETEEERMAFEERMREEEERRDAYFKQLEEDMRDFEEALKNFLKANRHPLKNRLDRGVKPEKVLQEFMEAFIYQEELTEEELMMLMAREGVRELLRKAGLMPEDPTTTSKQDPRHAANVEVRIKQLSREMAFALHPDQCGEHDEEKLELWHRVQRAVKAKDLDELEVLHAHMQLLLGDVSPNVSVSKLQELTEMYRCSRAALRRQLSRFRQRPSWGFHKAGEAEKNRLRQELSRELRREKHEVEIQREELTYALESFMNSGGLRREFDILDMFFEDW